MTGNVPDAQASPVLDRIRRGLIGDDEVIDGPCGPRRTIYFNYFITDAVRDYLVEAV